MESNLITLAWIACVQLAAWYIGRPLYRALTHHGTPCKTPHLDLLFSIALGHIALAYAAFALGVLGLLYQSVLFIGTLSCAIMGMYHGARSLPSSFPRLSRHDVPLVLALAFVASHIPHALSPVLEHDDNVYHLLIPKLYLQHHSIIYMPSSLFANMPHIVEMLYTIPMAIGDFVAPKVLTLVFSFWNLTALYLFACPIVGRLGAGLMTLVYISGRNVQWHLGLGYIEPVLGLFLLCACLSLVTWIETRNRGCLRILGLTCGFALASKYTAWFFVAAILAVTCIVLVWQLRWTQARPTASGLSNDHQPPTLPRCALYLAETTSLALLLAAPWLIKNFVYTGNPVYPNLFTLFGGQMWSEIQEIQLRHSVASIGDPDKRLLSYVTLPWQLVMDGTQYFNCPVWSISLMGLWLCAFLLPAAYRNSRSALLPVSALGFATWALTAQNGRFIVAWIPVVVATSTLTLASLRERPRLFSICLCGTVVASMYQIVFREYPFFPSLEVFSQPRQALTRRNLEYATTELLNQVVPKDGRVISMWENRLFFLRREFEADSAYEAPTWLMRMRSAPSLEIFVGDLAREGFTHVVINNYPASRYLNDSLRYRITDPTLYPPERLANDRQLMKDFISQYLEPLNAPSRTLSVYRIRSERFVKRS